MPGVVVLDELALLYVPSLINEWTLIINCIVDTILHGAGSSLSLCLRCVLRNEGHHLPKGDCDWFSCPSHCYPDDHASLVDVLVEGHEVQL